MRINISDSVNIMNLVINIDIFNSSIVFLFATYNNVFITFQSVCFNFNKPKTLFFKQKYEINVFIEQNRYTTIIQKCNFNETHCCNIFSIY